MTDSFIDYGQLIDDAMHVIVRKALECILDEGGLPGKHHFFISFLTNYPGVEISEHLKKKYPDEMTIVLQHQFEELVVDEVGFSVVLSFDNVREKVGIPFDSLVAFADPSVKFGLQFRHAEEIEVDDEDFGEVKEFSGAVGELVDDQEAVQPKQRKKKDKASRNTNVISLDTFRKK